MGPVVSGRSRPAPLAAREAARDRAREEVHGRGWNQAYVGGRSTPQRDAGAAAIARREAWALSEYFGVRAVSQDPRAFGSSSREDSQLARCGVGISAGSLRRPSGADAHHGAR